MRSGRAGATSELQCSSTLSFHLSHVLLYLSHPRRPIRGSLRCRYHRRKGSLRVALQPNLHCVVAADLLGIDVELDRRRALRRNTKVEGQLAAGVAADEEHQVRLTQDPVRTLAQVVARRADGQRVIGREHRLGVERRRHRSRQLLGWGNQLLARTRSSHSTTGDDHRLARLAQRIQRGRDVASVRHGAERRHVGELLLDDHVCIQLTIGDHHAGDVLQVQVRVGPGVPVTALRNAWRR